MITKRQHKGGTLPRNAATKEHVEAWSLGGRNANNQVAACSLCNDLRGNLEACAFYGLQQSWFNQDPTLRERWHAITHSEYRRFHVECVRANDRHLRRRARYSIDYAFLHIKHVRQHGHKLRA